MSNKRWDNDARASRRNVSNLMMYTWLMRLSGIFLGINFFLVSHTDTMCIICAIISMLLGFIKTNFKDKKYRDKSTTIAFVCGCFLLSLLMYYISSQIIVLYAIGIELVLALICVLFTKGK